MSEAHVLVMTDIVDSTALTERLGDAATAALWRSHDRMARDLLRRWRGREIDKSDGFLLLFDEVADALGYAHAYHRALAALTPPLLARAGIHVGPLVVRENDAADRALGAKAIEVDGIAKPATARIMSLAGGGQTLLSADARAVLGTTTWRVHCHGRWRLKGIEEPLELFEAGDAETPFAALPDSAKAWRVVRDGDLWLPARTLRHSLPAERDAFIGRRGTLRELARRFDDGARLVSLLGTGGTGKTRLAQRFGWTSLGEFPGGAWFCDLSQASTLDGVVFAVAQGLDVPLGGSDPVAQIGRALEGRGASLVIVDNFEQVSQHAEATLGRWLAAAAETRFIVTTREVLGIQGEVILALESLPADEASRLFMLRAESCGVRFAPAGDDIGAIADLARLLDGLPLAIELAAARTRVMTPRELLGRMGERFKLLTSRSGRPDRQATLRATFDWSWDLLSQPERSALAQLSVFEGGFTLRGAEAVVDLSTLPAAPWTADVVQSLVEKSLVRRSGERRFDLLRTVKDYAAERLAGGSVADAPAVRARQVAFFSSFTARDAVADRCAEADNLVLACRHAIAAGQPGLAVRVLEAVWAALKLTGPFGVVLDLAEAIGSIAGLGDRDRAALSLVAGGALNLTGRVSQARQQFEAACMLAVSLGERRLEIESLCVLGELDRTTGNLRGALTRLERARAAAERVGDADLRFLARNGLGAVAHDLTQFDDALAHYSAALELARALDDRRREGGVLGNLGRLFHSRGRLEDARRHYEPALEHARATGDRHWEGNGRCNHGLLLHELGRADEAKQQFEASLLSARELGLPRLEATVLCNLGMVAESQGRLDDARGQYEAAVDRASRLADPLLEGSLRVYLGSLWVRSGQLGAARDCLERAAQLLAVVEDAVAIGLLHCAQARLAHAGGDPGGYRAALESARARSRVTGVDANSELARAVAEIEQLGPPGAPG